MSKKKSESGPPREVEACVVLVWIRAKPRSQPIQISYHADAMLLWRWVSFVGIPMLASSLHSRRSRAFIRPLLVAVGWSLGEVGLAIGRKCILSD